MTPKCKCGHGKGEHGKGTCNVLTFSEQDTIGRDVSYSCGCSGYRPVKKAKKGK
jgi:hypothetical protein